MMFLTMKITVLRMLYHHEAHWQNKIQKPLNISTTDAKDGNYPCTVCKKDGNPRMQTRGVTWPGHLGCSPEDFFV